MVLLEDEHRTKSDSAGATSTNVDTESLGLGEELITTGVVKGDKGALALAAEVLELLGVALGEALELGKEVVADAGGVGDEVETLNLLVDGAEEDGADGVAHPGVELAVGLVGPQQRVAKVVAGGLGLLGEGDHVRGVGEVPVLVGPEPAGGADAGLDLVDDEEDVVLLGEGAQLAEEVGAGVVVAALALDGLDDDGRGRQVPRLDEVLDLVEAGLLDARVLLDVVGERVLELRERRLRPVKRRDVELVDGLGPRRRQRPEQTPVEARLERHDGQLRRPRRLVVHGRLHLLLGELDLRPAALQLPAVHKRRLVRRLVGVGACHGREHLVEPLGRRLEDARLESRCPVVRGEVSERGSVDDGVDHVWRGGRLDERRVVVTDGDGGDLSISTFFVPCVVSDFFSTTFQRLQPGQERRGKKNTYTSSRVLPSGSTM